MTAQELRAVNRKRIARDAAELALRQAVVDAFLLRDTAAACGDPYTVSDIAEAAGLSRERIYQIVKETSEGTTHEQ